MPAPKISIIGAGPGGLTLARLLQKSSIPCTIYEADPSPTTRSQGGTIDLHPLTGQRALLEAGLIDEFKKHARPEGQATKLLRADGTILWDDNRPGRTALRAVDDGARPEIDRVKLRQMLLDSVDAGSVVWGKKLARVVVEDASAGGQEGVKYSLIFADGSSESGVDLVVGADGAWSKVRGLVTDERPFYSGVTAVEIWAHDVEARYPWLSDFVGEGSCFMFDEGRAVICQRNGEGVRIYAAVRQPEDWLEDCGIDWENKEGAKRELVERYFGDCADDIKRVVLEGKDEVVVRKLWMLPVGVKWDSVPGVTLMGDAAHLMTPFAGVGVNVAMSDALELAKALIARKDIFTTNDFSVRNSIALAVKEYELSMFERGRQNAEKTLHGLDLHFSSKGGEDRAARLKKHHEMRKAAELEQKQKQL